MAVPSRRRCTSRNKRRQSAAKLNFKQTNLNRSITTCKFCQTAKLMHYICLTCKNKGNN